MASLGRKLWPLLLLLALSGVLAAAQGRASSAGRPSAIQRPANLLLRPFTALITCFNHLGELAAGETLSKPRLERENRQLEEQVALLQLRSDHLSHLADENTRLRQLLKMRTGDSHASQWVTAEVVERHPSHWFDLVTLNRGADAHLKKNSVVLTAQGLVGHVVMVRSDSCDVLLLTDASSNAGAVVPRTHDIGYVQGSGGEDLVLRFFSPDHGLKIGDAVVSSPFSALYPSGVLIGKVIRVERDSRSETSTAEVQPSVSFNNLEYAVIIP